MTQQMATRAAWRPWIVATGLCVLYLAVIFIHYGSNPLEFVRPTPSGRSGYDGQFTYYIARDPLNAAPNIDVPAYRYQRILHPALVRVLSLGQAPLIPWVMVITNLIALAVGTWALEHLLIAERVSRWYAITYGLFGGIFFAVRVGTSEPLAYVLVLLAILAGQRGRLTWQAILLALAALAKETTLFFVAGYALYYLLERRWRDLIRLALIAGIPFALWQVVLTVWLGAPGIGSGGAMATPFEIIPFNGVWRMAAENLRVFALFGTVALLAAVIPTLWGLWRSLRDVARRRWHPYVCLLLANAAILPFVPYSTYREPFGILRFLAGLVIGVILYAALRKARRPLLYSTLWIFFGLLLLG
ncbi:MAG: hypothetical protein IT324_12925 [Anaerolineae bacterium]|nr:hypothetical protein [Anaerolineae bacterium]